MDLEILKTFLEVARTRHFARTAENLCLTQAAVSARIAQLEARVGNKVFTRQRNNIQLTASGHRLLPYAEAIIGAWNRALAEAGAQQDRPFIGIGYLPSIGEIFGDALFQSLNRYAPETRVQVEQLNTPILVARVRDQAVNVGLLYEPPHARDLNVEQIAEIELVMVSSLPGLSIDDDHADYLHVDWGTSFAVTHVTELIGSTRASVMLDTPGLAHRLLRERGGSAYLPRHLVANDLKQGHLHIVRGADVVPRSMYLIHSNAWSPTPSMAPVMHAIQSLDTVQAIG